MSPPQCAASPAAFPVQIDGKVAVHLAAGVAAPAPVAVNVANRLRSLLELLLRAAVGGDEPQFGLRLHIPIAVDGPNLAARLKPVGNPPRHADQLALLQASDHPVRIVCGDLIGPKSEMTEAFGHLAEIHRQVVTIAILETELLADLP